MDNQQSQMWTAIPAIVQSVDLGAGTIVAQPAIRGVFTDQNGDSSYVNLPLLLDVVLTFPSAGGFTLALPIKAGDEVLVIFASRCIDAWWQSGGVQPPMELRMHDLSDGFAIPGPRSKPKVSQGLSASNARLVNDAGTVYLEITPGGVINMVAPGGVNITGDLNVSGDVTALEGTVSLEEHIHTGGTLSGGKTGAPIPT